MRSYLFVPGDDARKVAKALASEADAVILDLEDSVGPDRKEDARRLAAETLGQQAAPRHPKLFVRINALSTGFAKADLQAVMPHGPDGIVLPKAEGPRDIDTLKMLAGRAVPVLAIATETARSLFRMGDYAEAAPPLMAIAWGIEDLSADIGASAMRLPDKRLTEPANFVRSLCLFAAKAAGVEAIDTVYTDIRDIDALEAECAIAARDGFTGKLAIHPAQVPVINRAFTPTTEAIAHARKIVEAFENQSVGVLSIDGQMVDRPHLERAKRLLARVQA